MAAICEASSPACMIASDATPICVLQISLASCSTRPASGNICVNSFCAVAKISPALLNTMALLEVVPWSKAKIYLFIKTVNGVSKKLCEIHKNVSCNDCANNRSNNGYPSITPITSAFIFDRKYCVHNSRS